jgi:Zn-dependent peptidase ImmA (M78 family)
VAEVPVNGKVLQWARTIRGLSTEDAARLLDVSQAELRSYESGEKKPLVGFLRLMSRRYRINFTSLLMPSPLPIETPPTDHRARQGERPLSVDTIVSIEEVRETLDAFDDIANEDEDIIQHLDIGAARLDDDPEVVANRERKKFAISVDEQRSWKNLAQARRKWRRAIEKHGVFTYMIPMPPDELSGFSMLHGKLAAVCVNDREPSEGAKIFTLFHEYCHLLLRRTGISDENDNNRVERFCNEFAASFLVPRPALVEAVKDVETPADFSDSEVKRLATRFRISNRAMALRLEKTGLAPKGFYGRRTGAWDIPVEVDQAPPTLSHHPDYVKMRLKRVGELHAATVLRAVKRHVINSFDASELIGLQPSSLTKVQAALG